MGKIKKIYKIPLLSILSLIILAAICMISLRSASVQTWLFEKFSSRFSKNNELELTAGHIRFTFFNHIEVSDLLLKDNTADTLFFSPRVRAAIRKIKPGEKIFRLGRIGIEKPVIKLQPDTNNVLNLAYFMQLLANEDSSKRIKNLSISRIHIDGGRLSHRSGSRPDTSAVFDIHNFSLSGINLRVDDLKLTRQDTELRITDLSFTEEKGFELINLFSEVHIEEGKYRLDDLTIRTANSFINSELTGLDMKGKESDFVFTRDADLQLELQSSVVSFSDLAHFYLPFKGMEKEIMLSGNINGPIEEINGRDIILSYSDSTMLICDFDLSGLPDINNTFMFIRVGSLTTSTHEIAGLEIPGMGRIDPGDELRHLGAISFSGNFTGFTGDFVTYGTLNTELGSLSTDILVRPDTSDTFYFKGSLLAQDIRMGEVLKREDILGTLSASLEVEGTSKSFRNFRADVEATLMQMEFNDYTYRDIEISGLVSDKIWDGKVSSDNEDLRMDLLGRFDFTGDLPEVDFTFNLVEADLHRLNLDRSDSLSKLSMLLTANFAGDAPDNLSGEIRLLNSKLKRNGDEFDLFDCSISAFNIDSSTMGINLRTDYVDADIRGKYDLATIIPDIKLAAANLFPSLVDGGEGDFSGKNNFGYEISFKNTDPINEFFNTGFMLSQGFNLQGRIEPGNIISLAAGGDYAVYKNNILENTEIKCKLEDSTMLFDISSDKLNLIDRLSLEQLSISSKAIADSFNINIDWDNAGSLENKGTITAGGFFSKSDSLHTRLDLAILPAEIIISDNPWNIYRSSFTIDSSSVKIDDFMVSRRDEYFMIDGKVSQNPKDTINIKFNNLNLAGLNKLERKSGQEDEKKIDFILEGLLGGQIILTDIYNKMMFETDVMIEDFRLNDKSHGDVSILSVWDNASKLAGINVRNNKDGVYTFAVDGNYDPAELELDLLAEVKEMPLDILNLFLKSFASDVDGLGSGKVEIKSERGELSLLGSVMAENASMTIDYLQSNFSFSDSIHFAGDSLLFKNISVMDNRENNAVLDGYVSHNNFKDWFVDLRIDAENIMAFDTRQKDNSIFYGTAYASGLITIGGPASNLDFNISARTERNTRMFIPLGTDDRINNYSFISFREDSVDTDRTRTLNLPVLKRSDDNSISLDFELNVTPDAEVQLVFDSKQGDLMKARGSGTLYMTIDEKGDFTIFGDYLIEDGEYQFTLGNIFNKRFIVEEGGTISWNGDIMNANVDARAIYKLKASLEDLFQDEAYAERIPVECHLNISGQLINPVIGFDIYLPTADESMRTDLRAAIDSEEEMSRQFLYLLLMNSFYPDPSFAGATLNTTNAGASAMGVTTTEMLSNQLSNWLSQISNDFDIGFAYRPGNEISTQEVEVALSTQLLNDRVIINGNFDVGGEAGGTQTGTSANEITGDFDVEVKITEKIRFKVFNRSNDNLVYETAPYTQGFGLFFRQSFDSLRDLFKKKKSDMRREEESSIIEE